MTTELVTGKQGKPHIDGDDVGSLTAAIAGHGDYLLQRADGTWPAITMQDANHALIPTLNLLVEGRYARVTAAESVVIGSGQSGQKRNDLVCLKYTRDSNQIESVAWTVIKGTPTAGTPADPTVPAGSILGGSATAYAKIARIPINGLTPGTPVMLAGRLHPIVDMWDSATLYNSGGGTSSDAATSSASASKAPSPAAHGIPAYARTRCRRDTGRRSRSTRHARSITGRRAAC